ncbi:MAG: hypothetical protein QW472_05030 [Candidatus Aenigmatarchaeota archaeon]
MKKNWYRLNSGKLLNWAFKVIQFCDEELGSMEEVTLMQACKFELASKIIILT